MIVLLSKATRNRTISSVKFSFWLTVVASLANFTTDQSTTCYLLYLLICLFQLFSEPQNITLHVEEGHELNITCHNRKIASSSVSWTRNGIPVQTGKNKFLYIKSVNRTHAGNYICVSLSPNGNHSSSITTVDVLCKFILYLDVFRTELLPKKSLSRPTWKRLRFFGSRHLLLGRQSTKLDLSVISSKYVFSLGQF